MSAMLSALGLGLIFFYPYLIYRTMDYGIVWIAPVAVSFLYIHRAISSRTSQRRLVNLLIGGTLIFLVIVLNSLSAKFLPALVQLLLCWFFGRTLFTQAPLIERFVRVDFPVFPPGIAEYCRQLTRMWTLFFAVNVLVCIAFAVWADDFWWAFYTGVMIPVETGLLLVGEYIYRHYRFPDLQIPDPRSSIRAILSNSRKIWMDVHAP